MRSEAEADGESCHPDQKVLTDTVRALFFLQDLFHRGIIPLLTKICSAKLYKFSVTPIDESA